MAIIYVGNTGKYIDINLSDFKKSTETIILEKVRKLVGETLENSRIPKESWNVVSTFNEVMGLIENLDVNKNKISICEYKISENKLVISDTSYPKFNKIKSNMNFLNSDLLQKFLNIDIYNLQEKENSEKIIEDCLACIDSKRPVLENQENKPNKQKNPEKSWWKNKIVFNIGFMLVLSIALYTYSKINDENKIKEKDSICEKLPIAIKIIENKCLVQKTDMNFIDIGDLNGNINFNVSYLKSGWINKYSSSQLKNKKIVKDYMNIKNIYDFNQFKSYAVCNLMKKNGITSIDLMKNTKEACMNISKYTLQEIINTFNQDNFAPINLE